MNATSNEMLEGFTIVTHNKKKKKKENKHLFNKEYTSIDIKSLPTSLNVNKIYELQKDFILSSFFGEFKELLCSSLNDWNIVQEPKTELNDKLSSLCLSENKEPIDIVCYGLGSFGSCLIARYQLVFLIALKSFLNSDSVYIYDPIFSNDEIRLLKELKLNILSANEEAKRTINLKTVFFMPHCDLPLYNNLLWSNWKMQNLSKLIVIGNSFSSYNQSAERSLKNRAIYMYFANQFVTERRILNNYEFTDIFNNLSLHYFNNETMSKISEEIWLTNEEPVYDLEDSIKYF